MMRLLFLILIFPLFFHAQNAKKYPSLLWKITGNGIKKPSYLYGTMHVSNRVAWYLSEQFFDALKSVDVVGLETNPGEWLENMEKTGELEELSQIRTNNPYRNDFYKTTFTVSFPERRMLQGILSYDPDIINGLLYRQNRSKENFEENTYIDLFIYQSASKLNKKVISLENFAQAEINARLSAIPDENSEENLANRNQYANIQKIEDAYREGNLDMLDSLSKLGSTRNTQKFLIVDRNVFFVNTIDSVLKTQSLFSGVGAAHLPGEEGVIELLRKKGYTVEPITPKVTKKSSAVRDELDMRVKPVTFQKQFISDSAFSMDLPGKLYPIVNIGNLKYYIHADMVNGNFYTIVRLKHLAPVFNISPADLKQRVDSLLFENIPGKIVDRKDIVANNGVKGIEIINRTRRGDEQHYQIFFTDMEMILFKLGGKGAYASGKEAAQFFSSIQFATKPERNFIFTPPTKGFKVKIPQSYSYTKNSNTTLVGLVEDLFAYNKSLQECYGVQRAVYNDFNYLEEDTFELVRFTKNVLKNYHFEEDVKYSLYSQQNFPASRFHASNNRGAVMDGKIIIKGVHYYFVFQISEKKDQVNTDFLDSFNLSDFEIINPIKQITDKDFHFKVKDEVTDNALSRFNESYARAYEASLAKKDSLVKDFDYRTASKFYYSPSSNEYVNITFEKYNKYDYRQKKDLEKSIEKRIATNSTLFISNKKTSFNKDRFTYECSLKDTATSRAVKLQIYYTGRALHEISALYDTTEGLKGWTKTFMESFTPFDSVAEKSVFEYKFNDLLADLGSTDTVTRRIANSSLASLSMHKDYAADYAKFITGKNLSAVNDDSRAQLFVNGGTLQSEKIIEPYKSLYKQYTDSFYLQLCLLKGLAYLKTEKSFAAFSELLLNETPLVGAQNTVEDVFTVLHDSLELCKKFFPAMLKLTRYEEYRDPVYTLLSQMVHEKIISPQLYSSQKENILVDANLTLKRYNPVGTKQTSGSTANNFDFLEKASKDLAESITGNLEGLANNNFYKGSDYLRGMEISGRPALVNYAYVLAPFYKTDEPTKQFFARLSKIKSNEIAMPVTIELLKHNVVLSDTIIPYYSKNRFTRAYFYSELEKAKLTQKFDKRFLNQKSIIESVLLSQRQLRTYYNNEKDKGKADSIAFVAEIPAQNKYQKGKIFIYKAVKGKQDDELWSAVFVNGGKESVSSKVEIVHSGFYIDPKKTEKENIDHLLEQFSLGFRKRSLSATAEYE